MSPRHLWLAALLALAVTTAASADRPMTIDDMLALKGVGSPALSPDGKTIAFVLSEPRAATDRGRAYTSIWLLDLGTSSARRFTRANSNAGSPMFSRDGARLFFTTRRGEGAKSQLWSIPLDGGEATAVTDAPDGIMGYRLSPSGKWLAYLTLAPEDKSRKAAVDRGDDVQVYGQHIRHHHVMVMPTDGSKPPVRVSPKDQTAFEMDWAQDGALVLMVAASPKSDDNYMFRSLVRVGRDGKGLRVLATDMGKMVSPRVSPNGKTVVWHGAAQKNEATNGTIWTVPMKGGKPKAINAGAEESVYAVEWLDGSSLLVSAVTGTQSHLSRRKLSGQSTELVAPGGPVFLAAHAAKGHYVFAGSEATRPSALYHGSLKGGPVAVAYDPNPATADIAFAPQRTFEWKASDGMTLQGVLVEPMPGTPRPAPLIMAVHGGPEWQSLDGWVNRYLSPAQLLAQRGYAVLFPNYRGSAGRGATFAMADHKDLGGREFQDNVEAIAALAKTGLVDPKRVGMMGGSYGGYMSALAATKGSQHFGAAINFAGIANWMSFTGTSDIPYENSITHWDLWCYDTPETCWKASPLAYLDQAKTPLMIVHGAEDRRVPIGQAHELHTAFRVRKIPVELVIYPREGHGIGERAHQVDFIKRALAWFDTHLAAGK